jgi:hypothetical protein
MTRWRELLAFTVINLIGVGLLAFADHWALRAIGWLEVSLAISYAGIFTVIGSSQS